MGPVKCTGSLRVGKGRKRGWYRHCDVACDHALWEIHAGVEREHVSDRERAGNELELQQVLSVSSIILDLVRPISQKRQAQYHVYQQCYSTGGRQRSVPCRRSCAALRRSGSRASARPVCPIQRLHGRHDQRSNSGLTCSSRFITAKITLESCGLRTLGAPHTLSIADMAEEARRQPVELTEIPSLR
eukprot:969323-Rhodomonas_salina.3